MLQTISIFVTGKVQGVFFRQSTKEIADSLGIVGEVRNLDDGRVYIIASGTNEKLDQLITWCRKGPAKADVTSVQSELLSFRSFDRFRIVR